MPKFTNHPFPSQVVSDTEKTSYEYGLKIAKAIESVTDTAIAAPKSAAVPVIVNVEFTESP